MRNVKLLRLTRAPPWLSESLLRLAEAATRRAAHHPLSEDMSGVASKASPPSAPGSQKKASKIAAYIVKYSIHDAGEPTYIDVDEIGADWCNRMGAPPNIQVCHRVLAPSFKNDGFDPNKPQIGILRSFVTHEVKKKKLLAHNLAFSAGDSRFPIVLKEKMSRGPTRQLIVLA